MTQTRQRKLRRSRQRMEQTVPKQPPIMLICLLLTLTFLTALLMALFAAFTYSSTTDSMEAIEKKQQYCDDYYAAETIATEILTGFSDSMNQKTTADGNRTIYDTAKGDILVIKADSSINFSVPINKTESLKVTAINAGGSIDILQWVVIVN